MQKKTVLIADDDKDLVHMLSLRMKQLDLDVFRSPDAMHALMGAHRVKPDLVILDINMPGGNGLSVCEMLASDEALSNIPVIVMTGQVDDEIRQRCKSLGAHYVAKGSSLWGEMKPLVIRSLDPGAEESATAEAAEPTATADAAPSDHGGAASPIEKDKGAEPSTTKKENARPRILCIDDDPDVTEILKRRLETYGVEVIRAFNGTQGYWTALDMRPDVIITDMSMPDGEGNFLYWKLKSHPLTEKTPVMVLSGQTNPAIRRQMLSAGVDAFLTKPIVLDDLLGALRQHIELVEPQESTIRAV